MDSSFLTGANATFIAEIYATYLTNPSAVDAGWAAFFRELSDDDADLLKELEGASWAPSTAAVVGVADPDAAPKANGKGAKSAPPTSGERAALLRQAEDSIHALQLIRAYRARGHQIAKLDPLSMNKDGDHPELDYRTHGFVEADLNK